MTARPDTTAATCSMHACGAERRRRRRRWPGAMLELLACLLLLVCKTRRRRPRRLTGVALVQTFQIAGCKCGGFKCGVLLAESGKACKDLSARRRATGGALLASDCRPPRAPLAGASWRIACQPRPVTGEGRGWRQWVDVMPDVMLRGPISARQAGSSVLRHAVRHLLPHGCCRPRRCRWCLPVAWAQQTRQASKTTCRW